MKKSSLILLATMLGICTLKANAQEPCPRPELLVTEPLAVSDLFSQLNSQTLVKGEFETTAQFEDRKSRIVDPPLQTIRLEVKDQRLTYNADNQVFQLFIPTLETSSFYRNGYFSSQHKEIFGDYNYGKPVHLLAREELVSERNYEASNAYGATTTVTEKNFNEYVIFDNKGRRNIASGDNLFSERKTYETEYIDIPVPLDRAQEAKSQITMVALIDPKPPYTTESDYRIEPSRQYPSDLRTHYNVIFADIQCVGALDGNGALLGHWKTR